LSGGFLDRHYLLLRRLHSLSGIFPIGAFLLPHLTTNSSILWGRALNTSRHGDAGVETFQHEVDFIHGLPALVLLEAAMIWAPLAFHAILGIVFARSARYNVAHYPYGGNWRYTLQRMTGYVGLVFIVMHVTSLRFGWTWWGLTPGFEAGRAASSTAAHFQDGAWGVPFAATFYLLGVLSLVYHFANGLWTAAITWGLTVSVEAQRRWGRVCAAIGLALAVAGVAAVVGFSLLDVDLARAVEARIAEGH
jgi:succinate dehydrogenase / fumarate reductase cytochrome b subunit